MRAASVLVFLLCVASCSEPPQLYWPGELSGRAIAAGRDEQTIVFAGDIMTWDWTRLFLRAFGVNYPFLATMPLLRSADLAVGNLEGPVADAAEKKSGRYRYKVPPWTLEGLRAAGFDVVSLANNHLYDCGQEGLVETFESLEEAGIRYFGAGRSRKEASRPRIEQIGDTKVALIGVVAGETWFHEFEDSDRKDAYPKAEAGMERAYQARERRPGTVVARTKSLASMVRHAREEADLVVVFIHFGIRYHRPPTAFQQEASHAAIDAGADLVIGHHAHFWQPVEIYKQKPIVYGLGNFAFGSINRRAGEALIARAVLKQKRLKRLELFPLYIRNSNTRVLFQPKIMKGAFADEMLRRVREESRGLGASLEITQGRGVLRF